MEKNARKMCVTCAKMWLAETSVQFVTLNNLQLLVSAQIYAVPDYYNWSLRKHPILFKVDRKVICLPKH